MVEKAREREMELESRTKQKTEQVQAAGTQAKTPKTSDSSSKVQQGRGRCAKYGRFHSGACRTAGMSGIYSCGQQGHLSKDCPKKGLICFQFNQTGHKKADCPRLQGGGGGSVSVPAPATMRITDGRLKAEAPTVKSRTFQLTTEGARAAPDVVAGTFLVNGMSAHVLFDSGTTRSFLSLALSKKFRDAPGTLDTPLEVEIADDRTVSAARVYQDCVLNVHGERFRVDLVPIPLRGLKVIIGMDWLGTNGAMINCERKIVRVRTPRGEN
ncbi:uncharacterized protein LOC128134171 [Lactuca sativa]|uniref:uncharacterized protein LOC128134171 n=1 Tax=Lactuca sativa TaxID=4236 RepID=UPI0022B00E34|nr:uncharacterized protein LOC128134171 [Lactuca sativa]